MTSPNFPFVLVTPDRKVVSRHKTAKAAFGAATKLRDTFEPHAVLRTTSEVAKGGIVSEEWLHTLSTRIRYNYVKDEITDIPFGWY